MVLQYAHAYTDNAHVTVHDHGCTGVVSLAPVWANYGFTMIGELQTLIAAVLGSAISSLESRC
jgi:hypothetical protein